MRGTLLALQQHPRAPQNSALGLCCGAATTAMTAALGAPNIVTWRSFSAPLPPSRQLSSARFCGVFPGDGFSSRFEDSILQGCIPVVVQDSVDSPFERFLDYDSFVVRVAEEDIPRLIQILQVGP